MCACVGLCKGEFQCFLNLGHMSTYVSMYTTNRYNDFGS